jgi:peptidoglycan/LPS O-acetylase OafA/YrhL
MENRLPQLDGVRGIAILLVMLVNTSDKYPQLHLQHFVGNGWMGVDLFFVLSGFLITGILLGSKTDPRYFRNFFVRRVLRILPLYYAILLLMFGLLPILRPAEGHLIFAKSSPWWAYPLFLQNVLVASPTLAVGPLGASWSVAIEEQFYLLWPLVVRYCSLAQLRRIAAVMIVVSAPLTLYLQAHHVLIYSNVFCRQVGLMSGALLAVLVRSEGFVTAKSVKIAWPAFIITLAIASVAEELNARWLAFTFVALAAASFIFLALYAEQSWLQTMLQNRFLMYTGTISYGLYLLHKLPGDVAQMLHLHEHPAAVLPVIFLGSYALAVLSYNFFEKPFLRLKRLFPSESAPLQRLSEEHSLAQH